MYTNPEGRGICVGIAQSARRQYVMSRQPFRDATRKLNDLVRPYKPDGSKDTSLQLNQSFLGKVQGPRRQEQ